MRFRISPPVAWSIAAVSLFLVFPVNTILESCFREALACQCINPRPEIYKQADFIFVGTLSQVEGPLPLENTRYLTFDVSKSWKGVETTSITIHNDSGQCDSMVAIVGLEYIIFAYQEDFVKINVKCGGSLATEPNAEYVALDVENLEDLYAPIDLKAGHTVSINPYPIMALIGIPAALGIAAFIILVKRAKVKN